jgi:hypothetical protein
VLRLARLLAAGGKEALARIETIDAQQKQRMDAAIDFALGGAMPRAAAAIDHVFA